MKLVKFILLFAGLSLPLLTAAQETRKPIGLPTTPLEKRVVEAQVIDIEKALWNTANPRYMVMKNITPIYRQVADTLAGRCMGKLSPSTRVYLRKPAPEGYWVSLGDVFSELYYLPAKSVSGIQTIVEI